MPLVYQRVYFFFCRLWSHEGLISILFLDYKLFGLNRCSIQRMLVHLLHIGGSVLVIRSAVYPIRRRVFSIWCLLWCLLCSSICLKFLMFQSIVSSNYFLIQASPLFLIHLGILLYLLCLKILLILLIGLRLNFHIYLYVTGPKMGNDFILLFDSWLHFDWILFK